MTESPPSLRIQAYESFRRCVLAGRIRPGQFISQRELMQMLGVTLGAVREMIPRLEAARLITTVPKRGLHLAHIDLRLIRNAFQVRSMIEREAIAHFMQSVSMSELDSVELSHRQLLKRAESDAPDARLDEDAQAIDWGLHDRMVDSMGNEILSEVYRVNSLHVRMMALEMTQLRSLRVVPAMQEHLRFIAAMRERDTDAAVAAMLQHVSCSRQRVIDSASGAPRVGPPGSQLHAATRRPLS